MIEIIYASRINVRLVSKSTNLSNMKSRDFKSFARHDGV